MEKVRIAIIGTGQIGKHHLEEYTKIKDAEIVAVCNRSIEKAEEVANIYNVPHVYSDYKKMIERDDIDAIDVCLHNALHALVTIDVLNSGKNVYCEKPIADSYKNGLAMLEAARRNNCMLHIQLGHIYRPYARAVKRLIDGGALGEIYHARSMGLRRRFRPYVDGYGSMQFVQKEISGGGALLDVGVYKIALMLYLLGRPGIERISGNTYQKTGMDELRREKSGYNVEEMATGYIRFENNVSLDLFEAWAAHMDDIGPSSILGTKGGVKFGVDTFSYHTTYCDLELNCTGDLNAMEYRWNNTQENEDAYTSSQAHWVAALQKRVPLLPTAEIALDTMLIEEGIYLSASLGREVTSDEVKAFSEGKL